MKERPLFKSCCWVVEGVKRVERLQIVEVVFHPRSGLGLGLVVGFCG